MEGKNNQDFIDLLRLKSQVELSLLPETKVKDKAAFYEALKTLIDIKINEEEILTKFDTLQDFFTEMARGNFNRRIDIPNKKNMFSFLAVSLNAVIEELEANVKKNEFVQTSMECIADPAIITDKKGSILFVNDPAVDILNTPKDIIKDLIIANIFESHTQFGLLEVNGPIKDIKVNIRPLNKDLIPVLLSVKKIGDKSEKVDGYLYLLKTIH